METVSASLLDLPDEVILYIFSYLSFDSIAKMRPVCNRINNICMPVLNKEFRKSIVEHRKFLASFKPSPYIRNSLYVQAVNRVWFLKKLQKTVGVYVEQGHCAFYPGKILDMLRASLKHRSNPFLFNYPEFKKLVYKALKHFAECVQPRYKQFLRNSKQPSK